MEALLFSFAGVAFAVIGIVQPQGAETTATLAIMCAATSALIRALEKRP